jgi:hypothetical protein
VSRPGQRHLTCFYPSPCSPCASENRVVPPPQVQLHAGDAVSFDGNLRHAGWSYGIRHRRIHLYLDPSIIESMSRIKPLTLVALDTYDIVTLAGLSDERIVVDVVVAAPCGGD